ncbi:MAG: WD40-repeat-containing domain protein [Piptocephalis tieghemiana]|nr:MAG: WD40-repeat-containing domain protein [Piptocephalis tieghemiana]
MDTAPEVSLEDPMVSSRTVLDPSTQVMTQNVPYADLTLPVQGPRNPRGLLARSAANNVLTGRVEQQAYSEHDFRLQYNTYQAFGYAQDPSVLSTRADGSLGAGVDGSGLVGDVDRAKQQDRATIMDRRGRNEHRVKRQAKGDASILEGEGAYKGPWAGYEGEIQGQPEGAAENGEKSKGEEKEVKIEEIQGEERVDEAFGSERSIFHGDQEFDYLGRSYLHVPQDQGIDLNHEPGSQDCFAPKKCIHTWKGHSKAVSSIRFFPNSGHLLLSGGMDGKVKLWDVYHDRRCLRTFLGHKKAIKQAEFSPDGTRFLTTSYDRTIKLWDTETGKCIHSFTNGKVANCVAFHPDQPSTFLAGCADRRIIQWDMDEGKVTQEYDQHLGAVNTVTFVDGNRRFITTSDDKTLRAWEFGIPVVIKYIADPYMHSMPSVALHPERKWLACQSLDNQILVYGATDRFRQARNRRFTGHNVSGYACQVSFSPDGRFLTSGDSNGKVFFWEWRSCKKFKEIRAHDGVCIGVTWHPQETSKVATCGWDGLIKYWD